MDIPAPKQKQSFVDYIDPPTRQTVTDDMLVYLKSGTAESVAGVRFIVSQDCNEAIAQTLRGHDVVVDTRFKCPHLTQWDADLKCVVGERKHLSVFVVSKRPDQHIKSFTEYKSGQSGLYSCPPKTALYYMNCDDIHMIKKSSAKKVQYANDAYLEAARQITSNSLLTQKVTAVLRRVVSFALSAIAIAGVTA